MDKSFSAEDLVNPKLFRALLLFQFAGLIIVFVCVVTGHQGISLAISFITLSALAIFALHVLSRYRKVPAVQKKRNLEQSAIDSQNYIRQENGKVQEAKRTRQNLLQDEQRETQNGLLGLQLAFIQNGLVNARIQDATIPGIGPKLKERLAAYHIVTAMQINSNMPQISGFGNAKHQALIDWRALVFSKLDSDKPKSLPQEQLESIQTKFKALNEENDANERRGVKNKQENEFSLQQTQQTLSQFTGVTFGRYLSKSMDSRSYVAAVLGLLVLGMQAVSGVGSVTSAMIAALPTATPTAMITPTPAFNLTSTNISTTTPLLTPNITLTPTISLTPTITATTAPSIVGAACIPNNPFQIGKVVQVVDGDSIKVLLDADGKTYSVRYIGMDTPEMNPVGQFFAAEATAKNNELVYGKVVTLIKDVSETDRYGRLLRYVIAENVFVNFYLVARGFAKVASYPPDTACIPTFREVEQSVSALRVGIWGALPTTAPLPLATAPSSVGAAPCSCNGNLYNCSDFSSHASAQICYQYCISIGRGDVHRLDSDSDGSACESLP